MNDAAYPVLGSIGRIAGPVLLLAATPMLGGCVAALIPVAAAGAFGGKQLLGRDLDDRGDRRVQRAQGDDPGAPDEEDGSLLDATSAALAGFESGQLEVLDGGALPSPTARDLGLAVPPALPDDALDADDFLPGFLQAEGEKQRAGMGGESVVLMPDTDPFAPQVTICDKLPYAFLVELDRAPAADRDAGAPGRLIEWVNEARQAGIAVVFSIDQAAPDAATTERALADAGLGQARHGTTLWIVGDKDTIDSEALRWKIASNYCIVAMTADQPTDFTQLYGSYPDDSMKQSTIASLWNAGWFLSPEPLALPPAPTPNDPTPNAATAATDPTEADNGVTP